MIGSKPIGSLWAATGDYVMLPCMLRRAVSVVAALVASIVALPLCAQTNPKPWEYTLEERIALRTNEELARERVRQDPGQKRRSVSARAAVILDSITGKTHPELFLPHEVFDTFIQLSFLSNARTSQSFREGMTPEVKQHGLPSDFWLRLEALSSAYRADSAAIDALLATIRKTEGAARQRAQSELNLKYTDGCRTRAEALAAARQAFGRERFDRFLYQVIARGMFSISDRIADPALLLKAEEGCR